MDQCGAWRGEERHDHRAGIQVGLVCTFVEKHSSHYASGLHTLLHINNLSDGTTELSMMRAIMNFFNIKEDKCGSYTDT
jgi:hypothetical protein